MRLPVCTFAAVMIVALLVGCGSTKTVTVTQPSASGGQQESAPGITGSGTQILAPTSYPNGADVTWSCPNCLAFYLIALHGPASIANPQLIYSQSTSGTGYIPPGNYTLKISSDDAWQVNIVPR